MFEPGCLGIINRSSMFVKPRQPFIDLLKRGFESILMDQLNNWYVKADMWSQKRTLKIFKELFDYSFSTLV